VPAERLPEQRVGVAAGAPARPTTSPPS
jgi:hypothetical protein